MATAATTGLSGPSRFDAANCECEGPIEVLDKHPLSLPPLPALPSFWNQYEVHPENPVIGAGSFGTVFQVRHRQTRQPFACKVVQRHFLEIRGMQSQIQSEIQLSRRASSSNHVVRSFGTAEEAGCIFMLQELCFYGTLEHELGASTHGCIVDSRAACCARDLLQGLADLHAVGIIHRDIKLENLLVTVGGTLKIADFGWATCVEEKSRGLAGTFATMAPEILLEEVHTTAVDLWSAGAVLFHIVVGRPLLRTNIAPGLTKLSHCFPEAGTRARQERLLKEIYTNLAPLPVRAPAPASVACWDLLGQLLEVDPVCRPPAEEVCRHAWLQIGSAQAAKELANTCHSTEKCNDDETETDTTLSSTRSYLSSLAPWSETSFT